MKYLKGFYKMGRGLATTLIVILWAGYLYGVVGFAKEAFNKNSRGVDHYVIPFIWNFIVICVTMYFLLCWI